MRSYGVTERFLRLPYNLPRSTRQLVMATPQLSRDRLVRISKEMSYMLRHNPPTGAMDQAGWVSLPVLIQHLRGRPTEAEVRAVVDQNEKKRFDLDDSVVPPRIRAAQGHSIHLDQPVLNVVTDAAQFPVILHATSQDGWTAIQQSGELRKMGRTHIHFATQPHMIRKNNWANIYLKLNLQAALQAGHQFFLSSNDVLLCEGPLPVSFVSLVQLADLPPDWLADWLAVPPRNREASIPVTPPSQPQLTELAGWEIVEHADAVAADASGTTAPAADETQTPAPAPMTIDSTQHTSVSAPLTNDLPENDWPSLSQASARPAARSNKTHVNAEGSKQAGVWGAGLRS